MKVYLLTLLCYCVSIYTQAQNTVITKKLWNGNIYTTTLDGGNNYSFIKARYTMFIPKKLHKVKGILIHQHGCTMEGTGASVASDVQYQAFANKWSLVIISPDLYPHSKNCYEWNNPENGSEVSLFKGISNLANISNHPELNTAPWLLWGHSGGAHWSLKMLRKYPERTIALISYSAAFDSNFVYSPSVAKVPVLLRHAGSGDINASWAKCWLTATHNFARLKNINGLVSIVHNKNQTHNLSYIRNITIPFLESALLQRLPNYDKSQLRNMYYGKGWLADTSDTKGLVNIYRADEYKGDKLKMSWLPDSIFALKYEEYLVTGMIKDKTPPPVPINVRWKNKRDGKIIISWQAHADIESGIGHFNIYKNNQLTNSLPEKGYYQTFNTNGDNPIPEVVPTIEMIFDKNEFKNGDKIVVSTVNRDGLESNKSKIIKIKLF